MYKMPPLMRKAPVSRPRGREWMRKARWARAHFWPIKTLEWAPKSHAPSNLGTLAPSSSHSAARTHPGQNSLVVPSSLRFPSFHHIPKSKTSGERFVLPCSFPAIFGLLRLCDRDATILGSRLGGSFRRPFACSLWLPFRNLQSSTSPF